MPQPSAPALIDYPVSDVPQYAVTAAGPIVIKSNEEYTAVAERLKLIVSFRRKVTDFFAPHKKRANDAHKALCDDERKVLAPADADERRLKPALVAWTTEQDRLRRAEESRLRAEQVQREETRRLEEAAALETQSNQTGDLAMREEAHALIEAPIPVMPVQAETPAPPKVDGLSYRDVYRGDVKDIWALVEAAVKNDQLRAYLKIEPNQTVIDGVARSLREKMRIPGVELVVDRIPVTRTR